MAVTPVKVKSGNVEIVAKLLDSVAKQFNCRVHHKDGAVVFNGDGDLYVHIAQETINLFQHGASTAPVKDEWSGLNFTLQDYINQGHGFPQVDSDEDEAGEVFDESSGKAIR